MIRIVCFYLCLNYDVFFVIIKKDKTLDISLSSILLTYVIATRTFPLNNVNSIKGCAYQEILKISTGNMYIHVVGHCL